MIYSVEEAPVILPSVPSPPPSTESRTPVINGVVQPSFQPPPGRTPSLTNQLKFLSTYVLRALWAHKFAGPFRQPVDAVRLNLPDYHTVVLHPMDMGTVKRRIENYWYMFMSSENLMKLRKTIRIYLLNCNHLQ